MKELYYNPNNIEFRIVSSKAISQFKLNQAFDFNELVNNPNFKFSPESREILLLSYDIWFKYITKIEKIFVKTHDSKLISKEVHNHILSMCDDVVTTIHDIMDTHSFIFNTKVTDVIKQTNDIFNRYIRMAVDKSIDTTIYIAFPKIVTTISNALNNLLFQLQEVEYLIHSDLKANAFLSYTDECHELNMMGLAPIHDRAKIYCSVFGVNSFDIKNYTCDVVCKTVQEKFENDNFTIRDIIDLKVPENLKD